MSYRFGQPRWSVNLRLCLILTILLSSFPASVLAVPPSANAPAAMAQQGTPPVLLSTAPASGATWAGEPVTLTFDQPLAPVSNANLQIDPPLTGDVTSAGATVTFTPSETPAAGTRYRLTLTDIAAAAGVTQSAPVEITLAAATPLQVTSTQPSAGATDVAINSQMVVVFNRPVVPLTGAGEQADLPQPLSIEPAVAGQGEWLNTSVYVFRPTLGLAGSTEYQVIVDQITGLNGETLAEPFSFSFTTAEPLVTDVQFSNNFSNQVRPDSAVQLFFSQPMDPVSTEQAFRVEKTNEPNGEPVAGEMAWNAAQTTLTFTPTQALEFGGAYTVRLAVSAQPASQQGNLREPFSRDFQVVPLPAITVISPLDGAQGVSPEESVTIRFNAPLSETTVLRNIRVSPLLSTTQVYSYYSPYDSLVTISWFKAAHTEYTVTVGSGIVDEYGNQLATEQVFRFTTGDYPPFTRINLEQYTHFSAYTQTQVSLYYRNIEQLNVELYRVPANDFVRLTGPQSYELWGTYQVPDQADNRIWQRSYASRVGRNITAEQVVTLTTASGDLLPPGIYLLEVQQPQQEQVVDPNANRGRALIVLSNYNLVLKKSVLGASLAWLTDLRSGQPVADATVRFYQDQAGLGEAATNASGIATATLNLNPNNFYQPVQALSGEPGDDTFAAVVSEWNNGVAVWDFNLNGGYSIDQYQMYFYTDRPIYRPGQTVYWKGLVRALAEDQYTLPPPNLPISITVRDGQGNAIFERDYEMNELGTLNDQLELAINAVSGYYYLEAKIVLAPERIVYGGANFQVGSYEKPEFEISVTAEQPEYLQGDKVRVKVQADYFSGGALGNALVTWRLFAEPYYFNWRQGPTDRYYSFTPYDPTQDDVNNTNPNFFGGLLQEGTGVTAADGSFVIEVTADLQEVLQSQNWAFDATVQSSTNQFVSGRVTVPVHKGEFYIGLSPRSYVVNVGDESIVDVVTVTPQGEPYPAAELTLLVYEYKWNSVYERAADGSYRWATSVERTPVLTTTATTDRQGAAVVNWTPRRGGQYQIIARGQDDAGNAISSAAYLYISDQGADFIAWPRANNDRIKLVADKQLYQPGETATVLIPSPFSGTVTALVTIERDSVIEAKTITLTSNSATLAIPITTDHIPNVFVSVLLVKGVDETNSFPAMRVGYVQLTVDTAAKELTIAAEPSATQLKPGETVSYTLTVKDSAGQPVPAAEVSVALVDKAILSLAAGDTRKLIDVFYYQRSLGVMSGYLLSINRDRLSQQLSEGAKGGGGGDGGGGIVIREDFPDIAYWRAAFVSDAAGQIRFSVTLPDNLTTWTLAAKAITADTRVGEVTGDIVATKELQVRPLLPRFFTAGDQARIGAVVVNASEQTIDDLRFMIDVSGATINMAETELAASLPAGEQTRFDFPITVEPTSSSVVFTLTAQSAITNVQSRLADAVRIELPVLRYETPEVVATAGVVPPEGRTEAIRVPTAAGENGELLVTLEPSLAAGVLGGLNYLEHFPYECTEQTVSRFLPNLMTVQALRKLNVANPELENKLAYQLSIGVQQLVNRQNADGGWGNWLGEDSSPFISAYVVWGLVNANNLEYTVPERTLDNAISYLERQFQAPKDIEERWRLNELAFLHFVLAEAGQGDPGRASTLYDVRERLDYYGQALLAMALADLAAASNTPDERVDTLLDNLFGAASLSATGASWHEASTDWQTLNTDIRTTSIVLTAFTRLDPGQPLLEQVVRWLMSARQAQPEGPRWSTTQENAWAIIALTDWLAASGELQGGYQWTALLNGNELGVGTVGAENISAQFELRAQVADLLRDEANLLQLNRSDASGQLYYTAHLRYYLDALAIDARDRGLVLDRQFALNGQTVSRAQVGDLISVTLTIIAPIDLYQAVIEAPIPAGTEAVDSSLATTSMQSGSPELQPTDAATKPWGYWLPTHTDVRDDRVALFATYLPAGAYTYTFQVRATVPGEYRVLPAYGAMLYFPEVWGRSAGALFTVLSE